jgi:hypothetical protein
MDLGAAAAAVDKGGHGFSSQWLKKGAKKKPQV